MNSMLLNCIFNTTHADGGLVMTAADVLVETLIDWGVEVIFGLPGDGINGIMESLGTHQEKIEFLNAPGPSVLHAVVDPAR
jgi:hypothetical protein